jgi:hypothetical protein
LPRPLFIHQVVKLPYLQVVKSTLSS